MQHRQTAQAGATAQSTVSRTRLKRCISCSAATGAAAADSAGLGRVRRTNPDDRKHAIVIGGGIGGLVSAAKLAKAGLRVTLLEQGSQVGGRCQSQHVDTALGTFRFDTGPSLMLFPHVYQQTFQELGVRMEDYVPVQRVEPAAYRVWYEGNSQLDMLYSVPDMMAQLEAVESGAGRAYLQWLAQARTALEVGTRNFIERDFDSLWDFLDLRRLLPLLGQVDLLELLGQHHSRLQRKFRDPRIQALFSFQDLYVGLTPYTAPGVFSLLAATEITDGVYYPMGGFQQVKDALAKVATQLGVDIRTNTLVKHILTSDSKTVAGATSLHATGVTLGSGQQMSADVILSNRDVPLTYELLSDTPYGSQQHQNLLAKQYSAGVIAYNFCVKGRLHKLTHHNVFLSGDYERSWQRATSAATLLPRPNFYVHCPSRTDPTAAPAGHDSIMVLLPVANLQQMAKAHKGSADISSQGSCYEELVQAGREAIARTFKADGVCEDFHARVVHEFVIDPVEWQNRYSIGHGAVFGLAHGLDQLAFFRPPVKDLKVSGLYLVGASARPGNGVPLVMLSADLAVKCVLQDLTATSKPSLLGQNE